MHSNISNLINELVRSRKNFLINFQKNQELTFADVFFTIEKWHHESLFAKQSPLILVSDNSIHTALLELGCFILGRPVLPLHHTTPILELNKRTGNYPDCSVFISTDYLSMFTVTNKPLFSFKIIEELPIYHAPEDWDPEYLIDTIKYSISTNRPVLFLPTSGTTGEPKLILHGARSLFNNALQNARAHCLSHLNCFTSEMPFSFSGGIMHLLMVLVSEGKMFIRPSFHASHLMSFWRPVENGLVNSLWLVPTIVLLISKFFGKTSIPNKIKGKLNLVICGSAPIAPEIKLQFKDLFGLSISENYGLSETLTVTATPTHVSSETGVGLPLDSSIKICIKDSEICLQTPNLMMGYQQVSEDKLSQPILDDGWFRTGDLGKIDSQGFLHVLGRKKDLIIRGGINIYPAEVEAVMNSHPAVTKSAAIGIPDALLGEELVAVIELRSQFDVPLIEIEKELSDLCKLQLAQYKIPKRYWFTLKLPLTSSGKIKKEIIKIKVKEILSIRPLSDLTILDF